MHYVELCREVLNVCLLFFKMQFPENMVVQWRGEFTQFRYRLLDENKTISLEQFDPCKNAFMLVDCQHIAGGNFVMHLNETFLEQLSGAGMALMSTGNWRSNSVSEVSGAKEMVQSFTCSNFVKPIPVASTLLLQTAVFQPIPSPEPSSCPSPRLRC